MTIAIVDQPTPTRQRSRYGPRQARRSASARGPLARSAEVVPSSVNTVRACRVEPADQPPTSWRLTDRGIALVLALAAMIVLAAVTVIGLTAWRVTGPDYQAAEVSQLSRR